MCEFGTNAIVFFPVNGLVAQEVNRKNKKEIKSFHFH